VDTDQRSTNHPFSGETDRATSPNPAPSSHRIARDAQLKMPSSGSDQIPHAIDEATRVSLDVDESALPPPPIYPTPQSMIDKLLVIDNLTGLCVGDLTKQVQTRSRYMAKEPKDGYRGFPLFQTGHTGEDRRFQQYVCRQFGCGAYLKYELIDGVAAFAEANFQHNHDLEETVSKGADSLTPNERAQIQELTKSRFAPRRFSWNWISPWHPRSSTMPVDPCSKSRGQIRQSN
jgi:hypothetical protein